MTSYKLLLADDSLTIQKVVELVLAHENFEIKAVNDGEQALEALQSFGPHIVLADIEMPKMNGYQLCEKIKSNAATVHLPVILLAGAFEPFDEAYAKGVGADDYIVKPFESQELISKVKSLLVGVGAESAVPVAEAVEDTVLEVAGEAKAEEEIAVAAAPPDDEYEAKSVLTAPGGPPEEPETFRGRGGDSEESSMLQGGGGKGFEDELADALKREEMVLPSKEDIQEMVRQAIEKRVTEVIDAESVSAQNIPNVVEEVTRELVTGMLRALQDEINTAINRIVPEVAETIIKKEIEKITVQL